MKPDSSESAPSHAGMPSYDISSPTMLLNAYGSLTPILVSPFFWNPPAWIILLMYPPTAKLAHLAFTLAHPWLAFHADPARRSDRNPPRSAKNGCGILQTTIGLTNDHLAQGPEGQGPLHHQTLIAITEPPDTGLRRQTGPPAPLRVRRKFAQPRRFRFHPAIARGRRTPASP